MFCFQCEQTGFGTGCTQWGMCGKDDQTAALQDLLVHAVKGISSYAHRARQMDSIDPNVDAFVLKALFTTVTNVNFDPQRMQSILLEAAKVLDAARYLYENACKTAGKCSEDLNGACRWEAATSMDGLYQQGTEVSILKRRAVYGEDISGLQELCLYGLKGAAAYAEHARVLGLENEDVYAGIHETLSFLNRENHTVDGLLGMCLKVGEINYRAMELLDEANTSTYGHPVPTSVRTEPVAGKAILVSGHDLRDLELILQQSEGKGINVYTHGEMLPAHGYPKLKAYKHLVGNYGGAWMNQVLEFDEFPGAILMTTNCIQEPLETYADRIFTSGIVAWPDVKHIADGNFSPVIDAALRAPGFAEDGPDKTITVGFGRSAVLSVADKVIDAVKGGSIKRFFLIGGCDGARPGRDYYTQFAEAVPQDSMILTLACGKYRFNKLDFGEVAGLPRLLDIGQCNDAYSAIQIALTLADAFNCGVNDLPLSLIISWYEQKAVAILLTLLHLGIKNIKLGPTLPAFVTPAVLNILVENYNITPVETAETDLAAILN